MKQTLVVIGNGMVGHTFLEYLQESPLGKQYEVVVFCEESRAAYDRVQLTSYFSGNSADDLSMVKPGFFEDSGITLYINESVLEIDTANKQLTSSTGRQLGFDKLILATGSFPFVPPIPGKDQEHCYVYRTLDDLDAIKAAAEVSKTGVVIGGGLLGLEAAKALHDLDLKTHVVEFAPRLMAVQIDDGGGALLRNKIEALGVSVHTGKNTQSIEAGETARYRMIFADGETLDTDMIVFSAGIRPQDTLARESDIHLGERGGIAVNEYCQTSNPDIYAIGECAVWNGRVFGLVAPGYEMARVAVSHLNAEGDLSFNGADMSTKLKLMGVDVASIGDAHAQTVNAKVYTYFDEPAETYKKIVVSADGKHLLGAVMVGDAADYGTLLQYALNKIELPEYPDSLILPQRDGAGAAGLGVDALPDVAQICSCNNVSKGDLIAAIDEGVCTLGDLKTCTKAGTSCGGCSTLVGQVLNAELSKRGVEVNDHICEHFAFSRQELYHMVRVEKIKSFEGLLEKHGSGHGCEICKPAIGNIMASCWNDYILDDKNAQLQDTNDIFLANMQKNGTYSIVPRVPGGEITPDKLIAIGEVGKKYNLYTKITGGQRIDLFGAQVHELPVIWQELIDAGFESGHAYGKALRTVKSCVGKTWCRYGMLDSAGMAVGVEKRYRGLRSPHKLKMAVSGCTRECAEAQSKDVGVIATENGWNLYVCGNGGMKPRHADLFATDLDDETLIKYIDRFFMFYIRTADRLQRTSVWMDNLEGGLKYLQDVIINDSLGLAQELEAEMAHIVDSYQCEWKTTIENEEKLKRFRTFVNSDSDDANVVFVQERDQIRPATEEEIIAVSN